MDFYTEKAIEDLRNSLPPLFTRETACKMTGGIFSPRTLSNFDAAGNGPKHKVRMGRRVVYEKEDFIAWFTKMIGTPRKDIGRQRKIIERMESNPYW